MNSQSNIGLAFAGLFGQWDNKRMQKPLFTPFYLLAVVTLLLGSAYSQTKQTPPAKKPTTPAKSTTPTTTKARTSTTSKATSPSALTTKKDKFSYAFGMSQGAGIAATFQKLGVEFDKDLIIQGLRDGLAGGKTRLTEDEARAVLVEVQEDVQKQQKEKYEQLAEANKKEGEAFLAANKAKEGVVTLPDGLQYKILTAGTGPKPTATDTVVCHYKGTLVNGTEFDSSYKRNEPLTIEVGHVIKGWAEALQLMPVGSKWQLFIPSELAYGEAGRQGMPPNETLLFEVELLSIQEKKPEAKAEETTPANATEKVQPKASDTAPSSAPASAEPKK
jgi:FKBP-type peptidyl-prolyl cis-trans isomerase FklB